MQTERRPRVYRRWTDEEFAWLKEFYRHCNRYELVELFNLIFEPPATLRQLRDAADRCNAKRPSPGPGGRFRKGMKPMISPRAGKHPNCRRTQFKKGHKGTRTLPLYAERLTKGVVMIKIPGASPHACHRTQGHHRDSHWTPKARWIWTRERGPIPPGHAVIHKDGDAWNNEIDNLLCAPRRALSYLNRHMPPAGDPELEPLRVATALLASATHERSKATSPKTSNPPAHREPAAQDPHTPQRGKACPPVKQDSHA